MSKFKSDQAGVSAGRPGASASPSGPGTGQLVASLKALANENRLAIFEYLRRHDISLLGAEGAPSVGQIAGEFDLALSTVSHHLKELYRSGLIRCERRGKNVFCVVNQEAVDELQQYFSA
jgi:ArsR family transcriptional regulator